LEPYHGRAVWLFPDNPRVPFHGTFLDHEMRVCGCWPYLPYFADRPIGLPIQWQDWIVEKEESEDNEMGDDLSLTSTLLKAGQSGCDSNITMCARPVQVTSNTVPKNKNPTTITFSNPIANPSELEAVMCSARQEPNWKAAQIEGESWEGTAEANILKYQKIMHPPPEDWSQLIHGLTGKSTSESHK
jgi:hypothetical protein